MTLRPACLFVVLSLSACIQRRAPAVMPASPSSDAPAAPVAVAPVAAAPPLPPRAAAEPPSDDLRVAARGLNQLGTDLFGHLRAQPGNLAIAPASIALAFGMTEAGARGDTRAEMRRVLHSSLAPDRQAAALGALSARWNGPLGDGVTARTANRLFGHQRFPFEAPFVALTSSTFAAPLERVDFAQSEPVRQRINGWVAEQTMDKIRDLLPPAALDADTRLVLVNAMYLHAPWATPFPTSETRDETFFVGGSVATPAPAMSLDAHLTFATGRGFRAVELPYRGAELAMDILLPDARDGLAALEAGLTVERLESTFQALAPAHILLRLPRFRVAAGSFSLRESFAALGLNLPFASGAADFTGIASARAGADRLFIADAFHKVVVEVGEAGTEAAAATAVTMSFHSAPRRSAPPTRFVVDHPFVFVIRDLRTGAVLFLGRVLDPRPGEQVLR